MCHDRWARYKQNTHHNTRREPGTLHCRRKPVRSLVTTECVGRGL